MRVTESLLRQNQQKRKNARIDEDEEPTQCYQERKMERWDMNRTKAVFLSPLSEGINVDGSVFDRQAVFRMRTE